jgi:TonB family protein
MACASHASDLRRPTCAARRLNDERRAVTLLGCGLRRALSCISEPSVAPLLVLSHLTPGCNAWARLQPGDGSGRAFFLIVARARPRHLAYSRAVLDRSRISVLGGVLLVGLAASCKKPAPVLVAPQEVHAPQLDAAELGDTAAAKAGTDGEVRIGYCVDPEGLAQDVKVLSSFDPEIDARAVELVKTWRFQPATRDGVPYETCTDVTFVLRFG